MRIVDLNLLIYAVNSDAPYHVKARIWLERVLSGSEDIGFAWPVVLGFLRLMTRPGFMPTPLTSEQAIEIVDEWLAQPCSVLVVPGDSHWTILKRLLAECGSAGNLTMDAHLAALAVEKSCVLCSSDNDFHRFSDLQFENPLVS
ncbi:MAG: type II toxin-antitoxin system VapC family toxin [Acidobacteriota bacterium]